MLNGNQISGDIPTDLGSVTNLEHMDLSSNKFNNSIPKNIGNLLKLNYLNMSNKKFGNDNIPINIHILAHFPN